MWDRWVDSGGDIAVATTWERKVKAGVTANDIEQILRGVASERNMKEVGILPLSKELEARTGTKQKLLTVYSFCTSVPNNRPRDGGFQPPYVCLPALPCDRG